MPTDYLLVRSILFDKTLSTNWPVLWHQDLSMRISRVCTQTWNGVAKVWFYLSDCVAEAASAIDVFDVDTVGAFRDHFWEAVRPFDDEDGIAFEVVFPTDRE